jgi:hypothetical protein
MGSEDLIVRVNGVLSDVDSDQANTSISLFCDGFHLLVDAGSGVADAIKKSSPSGGGATPNAILITNSKKHHISDLAKIAADNTSIYCTAESGEKIAKDMPNAKLSIVKITPGVPFEVGPYSVTALAVENAGDQPGVPGSVIYTIRAGGTKIVAAWDFLTIPGVDETLLWNPDLLVIGAETYNEHPSTGMISISEAYNLVRRWNAKATFLVHYSGEKDKEDAKNQWHRGPAGPLSLESLQQVVEDHLKVSGKEGKFVVTVGRPGMIWTPPKMEEDTGDIGKRIEVDTLNKHSFALEKLDGGKLVVSIEDAINRTMTEFMNPRSEGTSLRADAIKSMMMKGPELQLVVSGNSVRIDIIKGKKAMFSNDLEVTDRDSKRLVRYLQENFK